ncbi:hypothetical protein HBI44_077340 [Parastagonospora nodorum]|nr:hypothetical protein HBI44_077340 [Parastagonospora nodorum]
MTASLRLRCAWLPLARLETPQGGSCLAAPARGEHGDGDGDKRLFAAHLIGAAITRRYAAVCRPELAQHQPPPRHPRTGPSRALLTCRRPRPLALLSTAETRRDSPGRWEAVEMEMNLSLPRLLCAAAAVAPRFRQARPTPPTSPTSPPQAINDPFPSRSRIANTSNVRNEHGPASPARL